MSIAQLTYAEFISEPSMTVERIAIIDGIRTPFCRAGGPFKSIQADELGVNAVKELIAKTALSPSEVDAFIFGNVLSPPHLANIARIIAVESGLPIKTPAHTVNRNCASGLESLSEACMLIALKRADAVIAGGTESMSNYPLTLPSKTAPFLQQLSKAKSLVQKLKALSAFRLDMFFPELPVIGDPLCGLSMGQTAEILAREFHITRQEQDAFALQSQKRAEEAQKKGYFSEEIVSVPLPSTYTEFQHTDNGIRENQTLQALAHLPLAFDKQTGTVTAGTSSQVTDGAVALLLMSEVKAKALGYQPLGYIHNFAYTGLDPKRMGLGPVFATAKVLRDAKMTLQEMDLIEINEAFASQVLACLCAFDSKHFAEQELGLSEKLGSIDQARLNVNGGAIALGHPLGASGSRLVLTLLKELKRQNKQWGLAALCVGGGQGGAMIVEQEAS